MTMMQGLPLTGVSVSANAKKRGELWLTSCLSHIISMHKLIASLYDGLETDDVYEEDSDDRVTIPLGDSAKHTQFFSDHCYRLVNMMREPTNGPVDLPLASIVGVVTRCLKVSYTDVLSVPSRSDLVSLLPRLHQGCMDVLSQLIVCLGGDILHQSHVIVDLCLQTLASTEKMELDTKYCTRSSTYQALVLWVRTCGWGKYLTSHSKALMRQIMEDTGVDMQEQMGKAADTDVSNSPKSVDTIGGRKRKGKKKKGGRGDSYLELDGGEDGVRKERCSESRLDCVLWAFSFSQLLVEKMPFSATQNLIAHIVKTASTIQRLSLHRPEPYRQGEARKGLYQAVAACLLSPLTYGCNRNDAVGHYQLTNQALDILARASHGEEAEIMTAATQALAILRSSSNLKGPVIRKALDFEDTSIEDISELMRDKDQLTDKMEDLRNKLMNSEMENEQQTRLISSLREQIAGLQAKVTDWRHESSSIQDKSRSSAQEDILEEQDDDDEDKNEEEEKKDEDKAESAKEMNPSILLHGNRTNETVEEGNNKAVRSLVYPTIVDSTQSREDGKECESIWKAEETNVSSKKVLKRCPNTIEEFSSREVKRSKLEPDTPKSQEQGNGVDEMLLDFVDAPPDS